MNLLALIRMLRPQQWLKNLMLFFPPFLGGIFFSADVISLSLPPFLAFCLASSATYIVNDIFDMENDRHHPEKCKRPLASRKITVASALLLALVLLLSSGMIAWTISVNFLLLLSVYILVSMAYSARLKDVVLVDIFCISAGFLLRLQAGGSVFQISISEWLFLSVFLLSVFLSTGKRLGEKQRLGDDACQHRKALVAYPQGFLEGTMYMTGSAVLVTYTMYVISRQSSLLLCSVPLCCFGLLRYILRVQSGKGGDPTESLTRDLPLLLVGLAWIVIVGWGVYG
jgi:4-hydroxybenzoate polyprenyltransferase